MDDAQLRTVWQQRQFDPRLCRLSEPLGFLMKRTLKRRVRELRELAEIWDELIPESIRSHTALDSFNRSVLTVLVDNASQRFHLQTLLTGGLMKEIQNRFSGAINKIRIMPGSFYSVDLETGRPRYEF